MQNRILLFDLTDNFFALNDELQEVDGLEWVVGNVQSVRKDFLTHQDCSTVVIHSSDPSDLLQLQGTTARSIWVLPPEGTDANWEANPKELEKALAVAGVVICTEEQGQQLEALTHVSVTPNISLSTAVNSVRQSIAVGVGAGIGNMCKVMPLIQKLSKHFGVVVDVVCNPSVPNSHQLFTQNEWVGKAYGKMHLGTFKQYDSAFLTSCLGDLLPPVAAKRTYVQRRHYTFWTLCRFMPELMYNFLGAEEFFEGLHVENSDYYQKFYSGSRYVFSNNKIVGLCGTGKGGAWQKRAWPYFEELAGELQKLGYEVRSYGVENEYISGTENYTGMPLRESLARLKECSFVIASDGGLMQLADAMGIPTIAIFGPAGVVKNAPFTEFSRIVHSGLECSPCLWRSEFKNCDRPECMASIGVEQVLATFDELKDAVVRANGVATSTSPPALTIKLFNQENDRLLDENRHSLASLGGGERFYGKLASHQAAGWMKLGELSRTQEVVDLPAKEKDLNLLRYQAQLARKSYDSKEEQCLKNILAKQPNKFSSALALLQFYRRNRKWNLFHDMFSSINTLNEQEKGQLYFEKALGLLDQREFVAAETFFNEAKSYCPQLTKKIERLTDTKLYRHAMYRKQLAGNDKPSVGVLLNDGDVLPESFRVAANVAYLYVYYTSELELLVSDRQLLDVLIVDRFLNHVGNVDDSFSPLSIDVKSTSGDELLEAIQSCPQWPLLPADTQDAAAGSKRILLFNHHHMHRWEPHGGEFSTCEIVKRLQGLGFEVLVAVPNRKNAESFCEDYEGIPYIIGRHENAANLLKHVYHTYFPDIILLHGTSALTVGPMLEEYPVPTVLFVRYWDVVSRPPYTSIATSYDNKDPKEYETLYKNIDTVICNAEHASSLVKSRFGANCLTSYVPVRPPKAKPSKPFYLRKYVTLINPRKANGEKVLRQLAVRLPHIPFRTYGQPTIAMPPNVTICPYHSGDYTGMYEDSRILLFPFAEIPCGTGRVVLEAYHCETPVVSLDSGGISEVVPKKHLVDNNDNYIAWAHIVRSLYEENDPESLIAMMRETVTRFDAEEQLALVDNEVIKLVGE